MKPIPQVNKSIDTISLIFGKGGKIISKIIGNVTFKMGTQGSRIFVETSVRQGEICTTDVVIHLANDCVVGCFMLTMVRKIATSHPGVSAVFLRRGMKSAHDRAQRVASFSFTQLTRAWDEKQDRIFLTQSSAARFLTSKYISVFLCHNWRMEGVMIPSFRIGADFPPSWYFIVAIPAAESEVVVKDMQREESESDKRWGELGGDVTGAGELGGGTTGGELGGDTEMATELAKWPVSGFRAAQARVLGESGVSERGAQSRVVLVLKEGGNGMSYKVAVYAQFGKQDVCIQDKGIYVPKGWSNSIVCVLVFFWRDFQEVQKDSKSTKSSEDLISHKYETVRGGDKKEW